MNKNILRTILTSAKPVKILPTPRSIFYAKMYFGIQKLLSKSILITPIDVINTIENKVYTEDDNKYTPYSNKYLEIKNIYQPQSNKSLNEKN